MVKTKSTYQLGKVSVIIPMYNRALLLPETLDSVIAQTYNNWECILVDDGSNDNTLAVAKQYARKDSRFRVYSRPSKIRKGANGCRNYGFSLSEGEFIQWFDSDDIMGQLLLESAVNSFDAKTDLIVCGSGEFNGEWSGKSSPKSIIKEIGEVSIFSILMGQSWFGTPQVVFRKRFLNNKKLFDLTLDRNQETEFFIRLLLLKPVVKFKTDIDVHIRKHGNSISGIYRVASIEKRLYHDFPAYRKIYLSCLKFNAMNSQLENLFKDFFFRCLRKMPISLNNYFPLFFIGIIYGLFPKRIDATKIFVSRLIVKG